jgi:hypothetical protein
MTAGTQISDIKALRYTTYRAEPTGGVLALALQFDVNMDSTPVNPLKADGRIVYEPYYTQTVNDDVWQTWDALNDAAGTGTGNWWIAGPNGGAMCTIADPCTWAELNSNYPDLEISAESLENSIDTEGAVLFKAGGSWAGFEGNVDNFVIAIQSGLNTHTTTYDFEPTTQGGGDDGPTDVCPNLEGNQSEVPSGKHVSEGQCVDDSNTPSTPQSFGGGGGGGGGNGPIWGGSGQVLGASVSLPELPAVCDALIHTYMRKGKKNDAAEVKLLQTFLNTHMNAGLPVTGVFGSMTDKAVKDFQVKYADQVLTPWGLNGPTGFVYRTTQRWVNLMHCKDLNIPMPTNLIPYHNEDQ